MFLSKEGRSCRTCIFWKIFRDFAAAMERRVGIKLDWTVHHNQRRLAPTGATKLLRDVTRPVYSRVFTGARGEWLRRVAKPLVTEKPVITSIGSCWRKSRY